MMNTSLDHHPQGLNMVSPPYCYPVMSSLTNSQLLSSSSSSSFLLQAEDMLTDQLPSMNQTVVSKNNFVSCFELSAAMTPLIFAL